METSVAATIIVFGGVGSILPAVSGAVCRGKR